MKTIILFSVIFLSGCASAQKVKDRIADDLTLIVQAGNCEKTCDSLKEYIKDRLQK